MKSVAIWILRYLLIPAGFLWAAGFFAVIKYIHSIEESDPLSELSNFSKAEMSTLGISSLSHLSKYSDSLVDARTKLVEETGLYDPYLYFGDLKQFFMFEAKCNQMKEQDKKLRYFYPELSFQRERIVGLMCENWRKIDWDDLATNYPGKMSINEARDCWLPKTLEETSQQPSEFWTGLFFGIFRWFLNFYLKGLPIAFVLFVIWRLKFKSEAEEEYWGKESKPEFESSFAPLSFVLSLIAWPVIVYRNLRDKLSDKVKKAELLSRRKEILSLLSKQDKELYALSQKMSLREFRVHLDALGLKRKHSFGLALLLVFFLTTTLRISARVTCPLSEKCVVSNVVIDHDVGSTYFLSYDMHGRAILPEFGLNQKIPKKTKNIFSILKVRVAKGFTRLIDGVPKVMNQFAF